MSFFTQTEKRIDTYICKHFPVILDFWGRLPPLITNDLGDLRICQSWVTRHDSSLMMLTVQDESYIPNQPGLGVCRTRNKSYHFSVWELWDLVDTSRLDWVILPTAQPEVLLRWPEVWSEIV